MTIKDTLPLLCLEPTAQIFVKKRTAGMGLESLGGGSVDSVIRRFGEMEIKETWLGRYSLRIIVK